MSRRFFLSLLESDWLKSVFLYLVAGGVLAAAAIVAGFLRLRGVTTDWLPVAAILGGIAGAAFLSKSIDARIQRALANRQQMLVSADINGNAFVRIVSFSPPLLGPLLGDFAVATVVFTVMGATVCRHTDGQIFVDTVSTPCRNGVSENS